MNNGLTFLVVFLISFFSVKCSSPNKIEELEIFFRELEISEGVVESISYEENIRIIMVFEKDVPEEIIGYSFDDIYNTDDLDLIQEGDLLVKKPNTFEIKVFRENVLITEINKTK